MDPLKGIFREEPWATPLLALSVIALCALLLYAVVGLCSWIKPANRDGGSFFLPWLQMPLLLGLMALASTSIVAAVPLNEAACRILFLGPGLGYVLLAAGLLSRIVQHSIRSHVVLQWLLLFFVVLNQVIISAAYLHRSWTTSSANKTSNKTSKPVSNMACYLNIHDQLLVMLYPGLLIAVVLLLVYRTARRTRSEWKSREAIHIGLAATFAGAFAGCWLGAASVLGDALLSSCLGYGCLATVVVVSLISLIPRQEMRPERCESEKGDRQEPVKPSHHHPNNSNNDNKIVQQHHHHHQPGPGRGMEKSLPAEPEIIIVPVKSSGGSQLSVPDMKTPSGRSHHHHHHHHRRSFSHHHGHHHRYYGVRHHHHQHQSPAYRWTNKLIRSDLTASRRLKSIRTRQEATERGLVRNVSDASRANQRTPYNHRGWLY